MGDSKYKIGIIVTWFGDLPDYFPAWLLSAEENRDVDFLIFSNCNIESKARNIKCYVTSLDQQIEMFEKKIGRNISINDSYKFCDCRAFFGITYADYLTEYDYWGYCDIDLMFGKIRQFLTDEVLEKYERFYQYGHLSIFKNNKKMNNIYELPGGIYSLDEIFCGKAKTTPEEYLGINRICEKNNISWYTKVDFADFAIRYPNRLEVKHGLKNWDEQIFIWNNGRAYQIYKDDGAIKRKELVYMHWQKRRPKVRGKIEPTKVILLQSNEITSYTDISELMALDFKKINQPVSAEDRKKFARKYRNKKIKDFLNADLSTKKMWIKQKIYTHIGGKRMYK